MASLKEQIEKAQKEEEERKYKENVEPMQPDIDEFFQNLKNYCLTKKVLKVTINYKIVYESMFGIFGIPFHGNKIELFIFDYNPEIAEEWQKLLAKWYFTKNGEYLSKAISKSGKEKGFKIHYEDIGIVGFKYKVEFTVVK